MVKSIGKKIDTAVFISGSGSNLNSIIKNSLKKKFPIKISLVISNNKNAYGINYAKNNKIKLEIIDTKNTINFERKTLIILKKNNIKLICLAGFMKILSSKFIKDFKYKILNIHPSLLPCYKGLNTHKRVLKNKEKFSGCTVHYVTDKLDSGKIILQKRVRIIRTDNEKTLKKKILKIEHFLYPKAIKVALKN